MAKRRSKRRPIGYVRVKGKYRLVTGVRGKKSTYRIAKKGFKTKKGLARHFAKRYGRRR